MKTKISVIIPVYNVKQYLKEAIDSITSQKEFLHEVILIDDGSIDGSGELMDKLYCSLDFVKIIHTQNHGQGLARNLGTDQATGEFIYYFDSDDIAKPGLFEKFNELISQYPELEIFCFSGDTFLDENYSIEKVINKNLLSKNAYKRKVEALCDSGEDALILLSKNQSFFPGPPLYIFKKTVLGKNNIKYRPIRYEDEEFTFKLFLDAGRTYIADDVYFKRRLRQGSTMQQRREYKDILGYIKTIETLEQLKNLNHLKTETKQLIWNKILNLVRAIITIKASSKLLLSKEEKKVYKKSLSPYILNDKNLFIFNFRYPFELKLRRIKRQLFK